MKNINLTIEDLELYAAIVAGITLWSILIVIGIIK